MSEMTSFLDTSCMTTFCARLAATIRDSSSGPSAVLLDVPEICVVGEGRGSCEFQLARLSWSRGWPVDWVLPWGSAAGIFVRTGLHVCHGCADVLLAGYQHIT